MLTVIGAVNIDILATTNQSFRAHDSNPAQVKIAVGGVAMNYAHNLSLLGEKVQFITVFSDDTLGLMARQTCIDAGIDIRLSAIIPHSHANIFLGIHNPEGDLEAAACDASLTETYLDSTFLAERLDEINASNVILFDTNLSATAIAWLMDHCHAAMMADGVSMAKTERLVQALSLAEHARLHTLKLNQLEYEHFRALTSDLDWHSMIATILVTRGAEGVALLHSLNSSFPQSYPALPAAHVVSTLGAGDAFLSGWAYAYVHAYSQDNAISFAQKMALLTLAVDSAVNPNITTQTTDTCSSPY